MEAFETERLVRRPFAQRDAADLFEYLHAPVPSCFLSLALADIGAAEREVQGQSAHDSSIAVCLRTSGKRIGDVFAEPEGDTFSVGWNFNTAFGGKGYAHEAATELFTERAARPLFAYVEDTNTPSLRLCERLGMRQEGVFNEFISFRNDDGGAPIYEDTMHSALLRHEWLLQRSPASSGPPCTWLPTRVPCECRQWIAAFGVMMADLPPNEKWCQKSAICNPTRPPTAALPRHAI